MKGLLHNQPVFIVFCGGSLVSLALTASFSPPTLAQIVPDDTLGADGSRVVPNVLLRGALGDRIDGGALRGSNLFHSFSQFNVNDGQRVYFANPAGVENILSRVTGGDVSDIMGTLGVDGAANLYLLNPNGIIFGPNAQLDIAGSFVASTGSAFIFPNGEVFSAVDPQAPPLLTINVPVGIQYGAPIGDLDNQGNLEVGPEASLVLHGNTVTSEGSLIAPGGTVQILGDRVALLGNALVDVSSETGGGTILIGGDYQGAGSVPNALRTYVAPTATINADATVEGNGGRVIVWADEATGFYGNITARGGSLSGDGGFVEVSGLQFLDFQGTVDTTASNGQFGTLLLDPTNVLIVRNGGNATIEDVDSFFDPDLGSIDPTTGQPFPGSIINADVLVNQLGNIVVQASNDITVQDVTLNSQGRDITLNAGNQIFVNNSFINSGRFNGSPFENTSGNISLFTNGDIRLINTFVTSSGEGFATFGSEGFINIQSTVGSVFLDRSTISSSTFSEGFAGNIGISAGDTIVLSNSSLESNFQGFSGFGGAGFIRLQANNDVVIANDIEIADDSITATSFGFSDSQRGNIAIISGWGNITLSNTNLETSIFGSGFAGDISLFSGGNIFLVNGSQLISNFQGNNFSGFGGAGVIRLQANNDVVIADASIIAESISSEFNESRDNILISSGSNLYLYGAQLRTSISGLGLAGNINLFAGNKLTIYNGLLTSDYNNNFQEIGLGAAGRISLEAIGDIRVENDSSSLEEDFSQYDDDLFQDLANVASDTTRISAISSGSSTDLGIAGNIQIESTQGNLFLRNVDLETSIFRSGFAGNIRLLAPQGSIDIQDDSRLASRFQGNNFSGFGGAGLIDISANADVTINSSRISASSIGESSGRFNGFGQDGIVIQSSQGDIRLTSANLETSVSGSGFAGNISLSAGNNLSLLSDSRLSSDFGNTGFSGFGGAGLISLQANNDVVIADGSITATSFGFSDSQRGEIAIQSRQGNLTLINTILETSISGSGFAGDINVFSGSNLQINNTSVNSDFADGGFDGFGSAGLITVTAINDAVFSSSFISAESFNGLNNFNGNLSGVVDISTQGRLTLDNTQVTTSLEGLGLAGNIFVESDQSISILGEGIRASASSGGSAGSISVRTPQFAISNGGFVEVNATEGGQGGDIIIEGTQNTPAEQVSLAQGSRITATATGNGRAGAISIRSATINLENESAIAGDTDAGRGGNIMISGADSLSLTGGSSISTSTRQGRAGNLNIVMAPDGDIELSSGSRIAAEATAGGSAGSLELDNVDQLTLLDSSGISVSSTGAGNSGELTVDSQDVLLQNQAFIEATTVSGEGGNIFLNNLQTLRVLDSLISASTEDGIAGNLSVTARDSVLLRGTRPFDRVRIGGLTVAASQGGTAGNLTIETPRLTIEDGATASVSSTLAGGSGNLTIEAREIRLNDRATIIAETQEGQGGNVSLRGADLLSLHGGSTLSASTRSGVAGDIDIFMADGGDIRLTGRSRIAAEATGQQTNGVTPVAGDLTIQGDRLTVRGNSEITVSAPDGQAGSLRIRARSIELNNGEIRAETGFSRENKRGAIIRLEDLDLLIMRNGSLISANALGNANGGNITIDAANRFIITSPFDNNDIIATAEEGSGGNITINAFRVFGFSDLTADRFTFDELQANGTSDLSASSENGVQGLIILNTLNVDPSRGLAELPTNPVDASQQIAAGCGLDNNSDENEFIVTGRGGLPPSSSDPLTASAVDVPWVVADDIAPNNVAPTANVVGLSATAMDAPLVEAQGMWVDADGNIHLVAEVETELTANPTAIASQFCSVSSH